MNDIDPLAAAAAEVPLIDFDEGIQAVVARVRIADEFFDVPPMPAEAIRYFSQIKDLEVDAPGVNPWEILRDFILRCLRPADRDRASAAMDRSSMTLTQLMTKGGELIKAATGFPTSPLSRSGPSSSNGSASTTGGSLPAPAAPSSAAPPGES